MLQIHAIYFDGTSYFVDEYVKDYDRDELELIQYGSDFELLCDKSDELNRLAYD